MADAADRAQDRIEQELANRIEAARQTTAELSGPVNCLRCGGRNDRQAAGYAVCTDCVEEIEALVAES